MEANIPPVISSCGDCFVVGMLKVRIIDETHVVLGGEPCSGVTPNVQGSPLANSPIFPFVLPCVSQQKENQRQRFPFVEMK